MFNLDQIVAYWWLLGAFPLAAAAIVAYRWFGWHGLLAVLTLGAAGFLYKKGGTDAKLAAAEQAERERQEAIKDRNRVNDEVSTMRPDDRRSELNRWVSDDEGPR